MIQVQQSSELFYLKEQLREQQKKLFILSTENDNFRNQNQKFLDQMQQDAQRIVKLTTKLLQLESQYEVLKKSHDQIQQKYVRTQINLRQKIKQYCTLHNYLYVDSKRPGSQFNSFELDLCHKISSLHQFSDSQIIQNLKQMLKVKNKELISLHKQISQLNTKLLQSSCQYQQQIQQLKQKLSQSLEHGYSDHYKAVGLKEEVNMIQFYAVEQLQQLKSQLQIYKNEVNSLRKQSQQYKNTLMDLKKSHLIVCREKANQQKQIDKLNSVYENKAQLQMNINSSLNTQFRPIVATEDLRQFVNRPETCYRDQNKIEQLNNLIQQNRKLQERLTLLEIQNQNLDFLSTTVFEKLKEIIIKYIPILQKQFRYFDFKQTEIQFIDQKSEGLNKALSNLNTKHTGLLYELNSIRGNNLSLQNQVKKLKVTIEENKVIIDKMKQEKNILLIALDALKSDDAKGMHNDSAQEMVDNEEEIGQKGQEYLFMQQLQKQGQKHKIMLLQNTIDLFHNQKIELLTKIKQYHLKIHQLTTQLAFSSKYRQYNTFNIKNPQIINFHSINQFVNLNPYITQSQSLLSSQSYSSIRKQLNLMFRRIDEEQEMLIKENQKRCIQLSENYYKKCEQVIVLKQNEGRLRDQLQKARQQIKFRYEKKRIDNKQMEIQQIGQQQKEVGMNHNDNKMISQSTICNIIQLLKKYEKQFNKFVNIYQLSINKINLDSIPHQLPKVSQQTNILPFSLDSYTNLNQHMTASLQELTKIISQKEQQSQIQIHFYKQKLLKSEQSNSQLKGRLQNALQALQRVGEGQGQNKMEVYEKSNPASFQSMNTLFSMIAYKNKEISKLQQTIVGMNKELQDKAQEVNKIKEQQHDDKNLYSNQQILLSQLIQNQSIVDVMQSVLEVINKEILQQ